ncbi:MAG: Ig-like domain-containing protein [Eudoraea sp.]|nr:Ig-like domain-containing protein [Eudoraea sp.]
MTVFRRVPAIIFLLFISLALYQCASRGTPSGGPKDIDPPVLIDAEPENLSINFSVTKIRLYFDEYIKLQDVENQLIVSPPLKYPPEISPLGGTSKYVEIIIKDTLRENTTYTFNFGESIIDNNEGNPNAYLTYVFSTGSYIDSLSFTGVVKDAFNKKADEFISVMLYEIDSAYTDSVIYESPPYYITNTLDSTTIFTLENLKAGKYGLVAIKDEGKNNLFDPETDKIGFVSDTIVLPSDSVYLLSLFREIPAYSAATPNFAASNKIIFGYKGPDEKVTIHALTTIPDTIRTRVAKEPSKDTLNFWFEPFETYSIIFEVVNEQLQKRDTFTIKTRKLEPDSLLLSPSHRSSIDFLDTLKIAGNIPFTQIDTSMVSMMNKDSLLLPIKMTLDSVQNAVIFDFEKEANERYDLTILPGAVTDFFNETNDTLQYRLTTGSYADYGNLRVALAGEITYPLILELTDTNGNLERKIYATEEQSFEFNLLKPASYLLRVIFDTNNNKRWDTGNYLNEVQPERIVYYPQEIEIRANWELEQVFTISE